MELQRSQPQGHGSKEGGPKLSCVLEDYLSSWGLLLPQAASVSKGSAHSAPLCRQNPDEQIVRMEGFTPGDRVKDSFSPANLGPEASEVPLVRHGGLPVLIE